MNRKNRRSEKGETLVEVMLAVAVLSLATVLTMAVMNSSQRDLMAQINRDAVRVQIDSQAELLHFFHDMDMAENDKVTGEGFSTNNISVESEIWTRIIEKADGDNNKAAREDGDATCAHGKDPFFLSVDAVAKLKKNIVQDDQGKDQDATDYDAEAANVIKEYPSDKTLGEFLDFSVSPGNGILISAYPGSGYYDFYIKACWRSTVTGREEKLSSLVRINYGQ
jgi:competence protein ComGC